MIKLSKVVLSISLCLLTMTTYSQNSAAGNAAKLSRAKYSGTDVAKDLVEQRRDTTFTRYYSGGFEVDTTRTWREKIDYTGRALEDNKYQLNSSRYRRDLATDGLALDMERTTTYAAKSAKKSILVTKQFLVDGLVEQITYNGDDRTVKCFDKSGQLLNEKGCMLYTTDKYPKEKLTKLTTNLQNQIFKTVKKNKGLVPKYILVNIESDYKTKSWFLSLDFPKSYDIDSKMYTELVTAIMVVLNNEKIQDFHFNKDINGNYYNHFLNLPINFRS